MSDLLMREEAPLTSEEWQKLDDLVVEVARKTLAGRRFLHLFGPLGAGVQVVAVDRLGGVSSAAVGFEAEETAEAVELAEREYIPLTTIFKDFVLRWDDLALARQHGGAPDFSPAAAAAFTVARAEDALLFHGQAREPGLLKIKGRATVPLGEWETTPGAALETVLAAWNKLTAAGFTGEFALVLSTDLFAKLHRVNGGTGVLEIAQIRELVKTIVPTPALKSRQGFLVATGPENLDLAIGQDIITAYLGPDGMDHIFRVFESLALRVKRPGAICTFE
jgi:uncharacterized linocin/CFP29 family protein